MLHGCFCWMELGQQDKLGHLKSGLAGAVKGPLTQLVRVANS